MKLLIRSHLLRKSLTKIFFLWSLRIADFDSTPEKISLIMVLHYKVSSFYFFATVKSFPEDCLLIILVIFINNFWELGNIGKIRLK